MHLPLSVPQNLRVHKGNQKVDSKSNARRYAAFEAVKMLVSEGELDSRFRPEHLDLDDGGEIKPVIQNIGSSKVREFHGGMRFL